MGAALIVGATLLGLAGAPHCALMCGAPCAALVGGRSGSALLFQVGRLAGYAAAGAAAAAAVSTLALWAQVSPALRPAWVLLQAGALSLGLWLVWQGRQPGWLATLGRGPVSGGGAVLAWHGPARAGIGGLAWVAWPCGLLQSALVVASMADGPASGAPAMAGFALASSPGLLLGPWLWRRLRASQPAGLSTTWPVRAAGLTLAMASGWALSHGLWARVAAFCGF